MTEERTTEALLVVKDLATEFRTDAGVVRAVDGISFCISRGETVGLVGESGCGKSATTLSILRLLGRNGRIAAGQVLLDGTELLHLTEARMREVRGKRISIVFQDPMSSLNPYLTVGEQLAEVCEIHLGMRRKEGLERAAALLGRVRIPDAGHRVNAYPHELSGGMRQRVMIAMALIGEPELLLMDEPTTALDVTIQAEILDLVREIVKERHLSVLLITHDLAVVAGLADRVLVMYAGRIVESASTVDLFRRPLHPYTLALLRSIPRIDAPKPRLDSIGGLPPRLDRGPFFECTFAPRCPFVHSACRVREPDLVEIDAHARRCVLPVEALP